MDKILAEWYLDKIKKENQIGESLVDFEQKTLAKKVWTKDEKLKPELKKFILKIFDEIFKKLDIEKNRVKTIYIIGSITGKYYNDYTDVDTQAVVEFENEEDYEKALELLKKKFTYGYVYPPNMPDFKHPINFYIRMYESDEDLYPATIDGIYDVLKDKWIQKAHTKINIDKTSYDIAMNWARKIEIDVGELKRDLIEYLFYKESEKNIENLAIPKESLTALRNQKLKEVLYDLDGIANTMAVLRQWRQDCQIKIIEEYKDLPKEINVNIKNLDNFVGIIVWKILDRFGYVVMMGRIKSIFRDYQDNEIDKEKLIEQIADLILPKDLWKH